MNDVLTRAQRRLNMSRIRSTNTKPEKLLRSALHAKGLRFRLHRRDLPGRPDIVFAKYTAVIFVHGCFWHNHDLCLYAKFPATRREFWQTKLIKNKRRDQRVAQALRDKGWRVAIVWECALRGPKKPSMKAVCRRLNAFLHQTSTDFLEIRGGPNQMNTLPCN